MDEIRQVGEISASKKSARSEFSSPFQNPATFVQCIILMPGIFGNFVHKHVYILKKNSQI